MSAFPETTLRAALDDAVEILTAYHDSARLDAEVLLAHVLERSRQHLYAWPQAPLPAPERRAFLDLIRRRALGEPVAHLVGRREFWSMDLEVSSRTLIPRPETETLVAAALARIPESARWRIADLGTGTGAVGLALARERPGCRVVATDLCAHALTLARRNARRLGIRNVAFRRGRWCAPLAGERFPLIVSNPPYVPERDPHLGRGDVRFEPHLALAAGPDGLEAIRHLAGSAPRHLCAGGRLLLEHGFDQALAVRRLLQDLGYQDIATHRDAAGRERVTEGRLPQREQALR